MDENLNLAGNAEIEKALKEFEAKSQAEQVQKAPEVSKNSETPKMIQLVMKWFGFEEQKQAEYVLLGFAIVAIGISLYLFFGTINGNPSKYKNTPLGQPITRNNNL
jgi:hypothetical protein